MRACALALLLAGGCRDAGRPAGPIYDAAVPDAPPRVREQIVQIERVVMEEAVWPKEAGPSPNPHELAGEVRSDLIASGLFTFDEPRVPARAASVRAIYGVEVTPNGGRAGVEMLLHWSSDEEDFDLHQTASCEGAAGSPKEIGALVECALSQAARGLARQETVRRGDRPAILAALADPETDSDLRRVALNAVSEHGVREAVPRLLELLASPDGDVRDGAIGALVALREPRAVGPLTQMAEFKDLALMRRVVDAVGSIGGDEAIAYLELVASGHDDPTLREMAQQALTRARRRAKSP